MVQPGTLIEGKYEILEKLREGGMGAVYKVHHRLLDEVRVVKILKPDVVASGEMRRRFLDEAKTATRLKHPNIATIYDFAIDEQGTAYLVMEFIDGVNLRDLMRSHGPPELSTTLELAHQTLLALGYLHRKNFVHRDIAPDNLMLTRDDDGLPRVKLIDLGIAKAVDKQGLTVEGAFLGKLTYASPELYGSLGADETLDGRSDLYSLGIVLYELLTGARPFGGDGPAALAYAHLFSEPVPFEQSDPLGRVPPELRALVLKALAKNRDDRHASADEMDREILALKQRYPISGDDEPTLDLITAARAPSARPAGMTVTPSAQEHLDRQFVSRSTPTPWTGSGAGARTAPLEQPVEPEPASEPSPAAASVPAARSPARAIAVGAAAVLLLVVVGLAGRRLTRKVDTETRRPSVRPEPAATPPPLPAVAEPTAALATPPPPPTSPPARLSPAPRVSPPPRATAVRIAANLAPQERPVEAPVMPRLALPEPTPVPPPRPTPEPVRPTLAPIHLPARVEPVLPTDEALIRETVAQYAQAQSTLDVNLFERVYPAVHAQRREIEKAFSELRAQELELDIVSIDLKGTSAQVRCSERRVITPKIGSRETTSRDTTIRLEKRGDAWTISSLR